MVSDQTLAGFLAELTSKAPTPGGGGASAVAGAMAASLGAMVANLTSGKRKYADVQGRIDEVIPQLEALRDRLLDGLAAIPHTAVNGCRDRRLPGNVSLCFEGIEGESLLLLLDNKGIAASSGSACTSGSLDPSHVLLALGRPHEVAHGSLRLSLSAENTAEEVDYILKELPPIVAYLRDISPVWDQLQRGERQHQI